jgi:hypothetical protein
MNSCGELLRNRGPLRPRQGDPYDTFDLVTALMLEATAFLATEGVEYPPGVHPLPREVQDRAARRYLGEDPGDA